ncbi:hypothetical protein ACFVHB_10065 [Kitasatospora sp. NPDC127111]|uniref:hypothetical protein n=1 Tax=Kitasatospora sp. NPDC127111 TaxID=3345363 RepID=UPI0036327500
MAILSSGAVYQGMQAARATYGALLVGVGVPLLAASSVQAARIWLALAGPPRRRRRP